MLQNSGIVCPAGVDRLESPFHVYSRTKLDVVLFPTADHGITEFEVKNGERVDIRFAEGYFPLMVDWILRKDPTVKVNGPIVYRGRARE